MCWMRSAMTFKTPPHSSGGVTNWTVAKSMVLESPVYPDGSALSNLMLNTVPERDQCVLSREKGTDGSRNVFTKPTVALVKRIRKVLVPTAMSFDCNALVNNRYGG